LTKDKRLFSRHFNLLVSFAVFVAGFAPCVSLSAQEEKITHDGAPSPPSQTVAGQTPQSIATIHWQRVPLREAIGRLHGVFGETVFADRRIDPALRLTLDIEAGSAEEVVAAIAAQQHLGVGRLANLVYLGPSPAAERLASVAAARSQEVSRLPMSLRASLARKQPVSWPRLAEPRRLVTSIVEQRGWRLANAERIPYDLWAAGELPEMSLAEQLTVLLTAPSRSTLSSRPTARSKTIGPRPGTRQVYTLRVKEQPVRLVLRALSQRLHWAIEIDEDSIRAAGKSLDKRVSFSVENADQEHLLEALLKPAGLDYRLEDDRVRIIAQRYSN
jgi:hypothetical protein